MSRLLVCCPYWHGDKDAMERAFSLAADLLPQKSLYADILFVPRHDTEFPSESLLHHVYKKFSRIYVWRCTRQGKGFPHGCNDLAYGIFNYVHDRRRESVDFNDIEVILLLEADCVFLRPTWVEELLAEWHSARNQHRVIAGGVQARGRWGGTEEHVNAVALYAAEILQIVPGLRSGPENEGWDHYHRDSMLPVTLDSKLFKLDHQKASITEAELYADPQVLVYHGVKNDSAVNAVRQRHGL